MMINFLKNREKRSLKLAYYSLYVNTCLAYDRIGEISTMTARSTGSESVHRGYGPIGVFDSGFGGLDMLRSIVNRLPGYDYIYLGDSARAPYGSRPMETVLKFTEEAVDFLFRKDCQLIVLACNTASSAALRNIQQGYLPKHYPDRRVLGVLIPAAEKAADSTRSKRVGVIATEGTVRSRSFERELKKLDPEIDVYQEACPLLVPIIEAGGHATKATEDILTGYLQPLIKKRIDTLIIGCTHYGILEDKIRGIVGPGIDIVNETGVVPERLAEYLDRHGDLWLTKNRSIKFYSTDQTDRFKRLGSGFFGRDIEVETIDDLGVHPRRPI